MSNCASTSPSCFRPQKDLDHATYASLQKLIAHNVEMGGRISAIGNPAQSNREPLRPTRLLMPLTTDN